MTAVNAGRPCKRGLAAGVETDVLSFFGLSLAAIGGFVTAAAFLVPAHNGMDDETFNSDQVYVIQQYLRASAERERKRNQPSRLQTWTLTIGKVVVARVPSTKRV